MSEPAGLEYSALATISGVTLVDVTSLQLCNGILTANPAALKPDTFEVDPANVARESDRKNLHSRKLAKHVLVSRFDTEQPVELPKVSEFLEKVALPLRLGTAGRVLLNAVALEPGAPERFLSEGSEQPAPFPLGWADHATLSKENRDAITASLPLLTYDPAYDLALMHFTNAFYKNSNAEIGLDFLLALETMFAPGDASRGSSDKVASRAAMFAATSADQQREMARDIRNAYKHRRPIRHGEPDPEEISSARSWFDQNSRKLRVICSWGFQRVLWLNRSLSRFDLMTWAQDLQRGDRTRLATVQSSPLCWIESGNMVLNLDLTQGSLSGGASIEFQRQFPDQV